MDYDNWKNGTGKTTSLESMMQLIKYEGTMAYKNTILKKIKDVPSICISFIKTLNYNL